VSLRVAPSIIAGDQAELGREVRAITEAGADMIHVDVMDGHFVPNLTLGPGIMRDLRHHSTLPFDCHLMLSDPGRYVRAFAEAGADRLSVHVEVDGVGDVLDEIQRLGKLAGIAINPGTPIQALHPYLLLADFVVIMTVHPGFYGQRLIPEALDKVTALRNTLSALGRRIPIQIDGGVTVRNAPDIAVVGADEVVAGAAVFKASDYGEAIRALQDAGASA
jgi:ribulose-phosphate 3-epimerase